MVKQSNNGINKWVLALICFFLGVLGVHRFVVGKVGAGLLYLFTAGFFGVGVIVDLILIIAGMFTYKDGKVVN